MAWLPYALATLLRFPKSVSPRACSVMHVGAISDPIHVLLILDFFLLLSRSTTSHNSEAATPSSQTDSLPTVTRPTRSPHDTVLDYPLLRGTPCLLATMIAGVLYLSKGTTGYISEAATPSSPTHFRNDY